MQRFTQTVKNIFFASIKKNIFFYVLIYKSINMFINQIDNCIYSNGVFILKHDIYAFLYLVKTTKKIFIAYTTRRLNA